MWENKLKYVREIVFADSRKILLSAIHEIRNMGFNFWNFKLSWPAAESIDDDDDDDDDTMTARSRASDPALTHIVITWVLHSSSNMDPRTALVIYRWAQTFVFSTPWHWVSTYYALS